LLCRADTSNQAIYGAEELDLIFTQIKTSFRAKRNGVFYSGKVRR
jgi:hypothetical protein